MCGICGIAAFDTNRRVEPARISRMAELMRHRGPNGSGFHNAPGIGMGIRRLSVIDLETGDQPISSEDGKVTVVCNGEIYNYPELRRALLAKGHRFRTGSDTEVIVHLYEEYGDECLKYLRGMFGLAVWDEDRRALLLARDRLGIKPLHYAIEKDSLIFASEQKSILAAADLVQSLDLQAMRDLFSYGFVIGPRTLFAGIRRLQPGHYLLMLDGRVTVRRYWDVTFPTAPYDRAVGVGEWAEMLLEKLQESVRLHLRSDVPIGAFLSGGIDSSGIVSLMSRLAERPVQTFSIAFDYPELDEVRRKSTLADFSEYGITNRQVVCGAGDFALLPKALWHCEDLSTSGLEIPCMMLSELASESVKVVMTGEGSDEIFGGYGWFHADKYLRPLAILPLFMRRLMLLGPFIPHFRPAASRIHLAPRKMDMERYRPMIGPPHPEILYQILSDDTMNALEIIGSCDAPLAPPEEFLKWHPFNQLQFYEMKLRLPDFVIRNLDRSSMAHSIEARVPFLDHELVEFCSQIPPNLKMHGLNEKYVLRNALRRLLPMEIVQRKKRGLSAPYQQWLRGKLPEFAEEMLSERSIREKGYFNPRGVRHLVECHRSGRGEFGKQIMGVLVVQLWDDLFLRNMKKWAAT